ncbi:bifunctional NAD(P)H-hydrate repair enzyme [Shewanella sp. NFH-SH190041]|uniref:NAD(P)H-hydrate dehydratase n=1 Tax=Shewanella sp. NFH-SH190041 TaxID=2950245 RepID=UPI0021C47511|nr:NAD(P)H-hydrate dehydratase [Shewanella sp. NFH-SH190041]BDM65783.1 bifunctional NAD(P)H-hydrate repair enzyme [Shewanella sp. NFH-SH190041]
MAQFDDILPEALFTCEQVRTAELALATTLPKGLYTLVERAGAAAYSALMLQGEIKHCLVLAGSGNNGSDALVLARLLLEQRIPFSLLLTETAHGPQERQLALEKLDQQGGEYRILTAATLSEALQEADWIIDGLLGTGIQGCVRADMAQWIELINQSATKVLSLDIPSGVNADTGKVYGDEPHGLQADVTVCFGALKQGLFTSDARQYAGRVLWADLGFSPVLPAPAARLRDRHFLPQVLSPRHRNSHKGSFGKVAVIGGEQGMPGAARLAAEGCLRSGAGLVCVLSHPSHQAMINTERPELMFCGVEADMATAIARLNWASTIVLGPGLGTAEWGRRLFALALSRAVPMVIDADGLNILAADGQRCDHCVLTPHPGEAARLLGQSVAKVEADRFAAVALLQATFGGVVVLKGAGTLICDGEQTWLAPVGNPGLAGGGCGDVLSGIIGALLAQGLSPAEAAVAGVVIHGEAADLAARDGERGMLASDLFPFIRRLVNPDMT